MSAETYDFLVIGGGVIGTAIARELGSCGKRVILCEKDADLLCGASSGNTGHLATNFYYTRARATLEAEMSARAREVNPGWLEGQPAVPRVKTGMIYLARGAEDEATLEEMLGHARLNQVAGVRRLSLAEVAALEPGLCLAGVTAALHSAEETIVDSWLLSMTHVHGLAVAGVEARTSCEVTAVARTAAGDWAAATSQGTVRAACVINCAGNFGDNVEKMGRDRVHFTVTPAKGEYLVFSGPSEATLRTPVVPVPSKQTAGVYTFRSVYGHLVVGPTNVRQQDREDRRVSSEARAFMLQHLATLLPGHTHELVGGFSGLRPATEHQDYVISLDTARGWVTVAGIRSTGLSCSLAISQYVAAALVPDYRPAAVPEMPAPRVTEDGRVEVGGRVYTPTHPLTRLGLLGLPLPQSFVTASY